MNNRLLKDGLIVSKFDKKLHLGIGERLDMLTNGKSNRHSRHMSINDYLEQTSIPRGPVTIVTNI